MFDLFDMFDDIPDVEVHKEEKEKNKSKSEKNEKKNSSKTSNVSAKKYKLPIKVFTDYAQIQLELDEDAGITELTETEIIEKVCNDKMFYKGCQLEVLSENEFLLCRPSYGEIRKGNIEITEETQFLMDSQILDISSLTQGLSNISVEKLIEYFTNTYNIGMCIYSVGDNAYAVTHDMSSKGTAEKLHFPFLMEIATNEMVTVTKEMYADAMDDNKEVETMSLSFLDDEDEQKAEPKIDMNGLYKLAEKLDSHYKGGHSIIAINAEKNFVRVLFKRKFSTPPAAKKEPKKVMLPTNATIDLGYKQIPLQPSFFAGKEEVEDVEVIKYLGKMYNRYTVQRTELQYDKGPNKIVPILISSKRGANKSHDTNCIEDNDMIYLNIDKSGNGDFELKYGKLPYSLLLSAVHFFNKVYEAYKTEAAVVFLLNPISGEYSLYVPNQYVSDSTVEMFFSAEIQRNFWMVGTIHSHSEYSAFFSEEDNKNELAPGIYGVVGNFGTKKATLKFRVGASGYFTDVRISDIFDVNNKDNVQDLWNETNISAIHVVGNKHVASL